jgi:OPA family sugar phosphate sensor protein UhpC-like MFS transporter
MSAMEHSDAAEARGAPALPATATLRLQRRYRRWRWTVFSLTWLVYAGYYFTRKSFPVAKIGILEDPAMAIDKTAMGWIDGAYGIAYALGQLVWGIAGDRFGSRRIVFGGMLGSVAAALAMGLSTHVILFGVLFFFQGLFQSTGWPPLAKTMSHWFSQRERGLVFGFWCTNYVVGGMLASAFAGYAAYLTGSWRMAFFAPAAVLLLLALLFRVLHREKPQDLGLPPVELHQEGEGRSAAESAPAAAAITAWATIALVLRNPMIVRMGLVFFLLKPTRYAFLFWGPLIAYEKLGTNIGSSALIGAAFEAAGPIATIFAGYASDKWFQARRMPVIVPSLFALALALFLFTDLTNLGGAWTMAAVFFVVGILLHGPESMLGGAAAVDFGGSEGAASAAGFINCLGSVGQIMGLALPGIISATYGWDALFTVFAIATLAGALLLVGKWNAVPGAV